MPGRQPRRLRLHVQPRPAAVAQEPARQQRRRRDHRRRRRRPQPQLRRPSGATTTRARRPTRPARPTAARRRAPSRRRRRSTGCCDRVGFEFLVNYHSAAELLLYGVGWQVATPTPGRRDLRGDGRRRRRTRPCPGYDPDISAELYTTNGDTDTHTHERVRHARLHPGDVDLRDGLRGRPRRRVGARGLRQRLRVPRRRGAGPGRVREEHPVRAVGRRSRRTTPTTRSPSVGRDARRTSSSTRFDVSYGDPQTVAVMRQARAAATCGCTTASTAAAPQTRRVARVARRRALRRRERRLLRRVPRQGPRGRRRATRSRSGSPGVEAAARGSVHERAVHLHGRRPTPGADVLVLANEDYTGVNPTYPAGHDRAEVRRATTSPRSRPPATPPTSGTSTRRACRTTSACSATTTPWSGTSATTGSPRTPRTS